MIFKKTNIFCKDKLKYTQLAFLVDKPSFIKKTINFRKKWLKKNILLTYAEYSDWWWKIGENMQTSIDKINPKLKKLEFELSREDLLREDKTRKSIEIDKKMEKIERTVPYLDYVKDVHYLMFEFGIPGTYYDGICRILMCGLIKEEYWTSNSIELQEPNFHGTPIEQSEKEPLAYMIITPNTTRNEILELFKTNINKVKKLYEKSDYKIIKYAKDTISNIERDRNWYWMHLPLNKFGQGKSYSQIANHEFGNKNGLKYVSRVIKAIKQYQKNLY